MSEFVFVAGAIAAAVSIVGLMGRFAVAVVRRPIRRHTAYRRG